MTYAVTYAVTQWVHVVPIFTTHGYIFKMVKEIGHRVPHPICDTIASRVRSSKYYVDKSLLYRESNHIEPMRSQLFYDISCIVLSERITFLFRIYDVRPAASSTTLSLKKRCLS